MSVLSFAPSAEKPLLASMTARGTKDCIVERRNLFAVVILVQGAVGAAVGDLPVQTPSEGISAAKLAGFASSRSLTRKRWSDSVCSMSR